MTPEQIEALTEQRRVVHKWAIEKIDWCKNPDVHKRYGDANHLTLKQRRAECQTMRELYAWLGTIIEAAK